MERETTTISVIVPTWNERERITEAVARARLVGDEVIVADAGSPDGTRELAERAGAVVVPCSARGRGAQLRAGASRATGDVLLFLHADATLPPEARGAILRALVGPDVVGGNFALRFAPPSFAANLFTRVNDVRRRFFHIYYGDSAIFVRRSVYEELGGVRPFPILEDYDLVRRLERRGRTAYVRDVEVHASARRFEGAPLRTLFVWSCLQVLFSVFGVSPYRLARHYGDIR